MKHRTYNMKRALSTLLLAVATLSAWGTVHNVTIKAQPTNATIKVGELTTDITAASGSTVTVTIAPDAGYFLKADQIYLEVKAYIDGSGAQVRTRSEPDYINITVTPGTGGNYTFTMPDYDVEVSATVTPLAVTIDQSDTEHYTYTGSAIDPIVKIGDNVATKGTDFTITYTTGHTDYGTATVNSVTGTGSYWGTALAGATFNILAKAITITAKEQTITYGDNIATGVDQVNHTALATGHQLSSITLTKTKTAASDTPYDDDIVPSAAEILNGDVVVTANYNITYTPGDLTINKRPVTVSGITANEKNYDGTTAATLVYTGLTIAGKKDGDDLSATANGTFDSANAGSRTVTLNNLTLTGGSVANYVLAAEGQQTSVTGVTINKTTPVIVTPPTATPATIAYGDALSVSTLAGGSVQNLVPTTPIAVSGTWAWTDPTTVPGGGVNQKFSVTFTPTDTDNYNSVSSGDDEDKKATITVSQHNLTITANPKTITYGDAPANDGVTYSGFLGTDDASSLTGTLTYTYNTLANGSGATYAAGSDVGTYKIIPAGLTSDNYTITFVAGDLTVEKKALTITANDQTIAHGGVIVTTEGAEAGWIKSADVVEGQTLNVTLTPTDAVSPQTKKTIVPTATITKEAADVTANYELTLVPAVLTETVSVPVASGWTTYWQGTADLKKPDTELTPYIVTNVTSEAVTAAEQAYIQKNTPYLLYYSGTETSVDLEVIYNQTPVTGMDAKFKTSSNIDATSANNYYVLQSGSFVWSQGNIPAGKCYIDLGTGAGARHRSLGINTGDGTTGISDVEREMPDMEGMYDLQGRKVTGHVRSGIYIKNGKKVFIK